MNISPSISVKKVLNDLSSLKFCLNWKQFRDVEIRNMSEFQVCSVKRNIGADENIFLEYFRKAHSASVQYCATRPVWNKSEADPGEHLRFAPAVKNISQVWKNKNYYFDKDGGKISIFCGKMVTTMMWLNVDLPLLRCGDGKVEAWGDESSGAHGKMDFQEFPTNSIVPLNQFDLHRFPEFWYLSKKFQVDLKKCSTLLVSHWSKARIFFFRP